MNKQMLYVSFPICVAIIVAGAWLTHAGPLTPPPGPVTSTGRFSPRTEITGLPFTIASSGSYYLGSSLLAPGPGVGITISANNVDIDLNGFELIGVGGGPGDTAVALTGGFTNTAVHDGTIRGWGDVGLNLGLGSYAHVYNVRAHDCNGDGIRLGSWGIARNCIAASNAVGIITIENCKITNCVTPNNLLDGLIAGFGSHVSHCVSSNNGRRGFLLIGECALIGSTANLNAEHGVEAFTSCRISDCTASDNGAGGALGSGFLTDDGNDLEGCAADRNLEDGIVLLTRGTCVNSTANDNGDDGFDVTSATVANCEASQNGANGILASQSLIKSSTTHDNTLAGINVTDGCHVYRNNSNSNIGDGIIASGSLNNIEFNHCVTNGGAAIMTTNGGPDSVMSNRESGNGMTYVTEAADSVGPIFVGPGLVVTAPADKFVNISY
ncbi:MAG: right-handed parallel beta-helix repeat-containing protein [Phycisphaerales bacterium]|nr:right-handed parallel beta-helix repeat-containing protein [Phycisphaerales bacterium]